MLQPLDQILRTYDSTAALKNAETIPAPWYVDSRIDQLERTSVFARSWQFVGRTEQVAQVGQYVTATVASEPIVVVRGKDKVLRAFFNVCRHHAAAVMTQPCGQASVLKCPYHGWTYGLDGALKTMPEFDGVCDFELANNGLVPLEVGVWQQFVFVRVQPGGPSLVDWLGSMGQNAAGLNLTSLKFYERREYVLNCNWKVYVDNYLDGGYHVPHIHKGLGSVLNYAKYTIENQGSCCLQSSPIDGGNGDAATASVRKGEMAFYFWWYPNFMLNWYEGVMDVDIAVPLGVDRCRVIFDFYFADNEASADEYNRRSIAVAERIQQEDIDICESVQRGLGSRAYNAGRLSVRREAGEHLFHRLLAHDLTANDSV